MTTGIIIPCYNEAKRLDRNAFLQAIVQYPDYHLCFVNDGSKDDTLAVLLELQATNPTRISVVNCGQNGGKAEAVRQGALFLLKHIDIDFVGFLDADLATDFESYNTLTEIIAKQEFKVVCGSRVKRMGADIHRSLKRHLIGRSVATLIGAMLDMSVYDTQCGAKVFSKDVAARVFKMPFLSTWLFDVEIFFRIKQHYGAKNADSLIWEQPLKRWVHVGDSKITWKESYRTPIQLAKLHFNYNMRAQLSQLQPAGAVELAWR